MGIEKNEYRINTNNIKMSSSLSAFESFLNILACNCSKECNIVCGCRKHRLKCSVICNNCRGNACLNTMELIEEDDVDILLEINTEVETEDQNTDELHI